MVVAWAVGGNLRHGEADPGRIRGGGALRHAAFGRARDSTKIRHEVSASATGALQKNEPPLAEQR